MASQLTNVSYAVRQYGLSVVLTFIGVILVWNLGKIGYDACCTTKATPTPMASPIYGKLEGLQFKTTPSLSKNITLNLETISGDLPPLATASGTVYRVKDKKAGLDYAQKAKTAAQKLGFIDPILTQNSQNSFLFINPKDQNERLDYNFVFDNFEYKFENSESYVSLEIGSAPTAAKADEYAKKILQNIRNDIYAQTITNEAQKFIANSSYYYFEPATGQKTKVNTQPQANVTILDYNRPSINGVPIISHSTTEALINFIFTGYTSSSNNGDLVRLIRANIVMWPIETDGILGSYPLRSPTRAWNNLKNGKGYILNESKSGNEYNIRRVYLAYFEPDIQAKYIQPVWVFEGDKPDDSKFLFRAIVPAVEDEYISPIE